MAVPNFLQEKLDKYEQEKEQLAGTQDETTSIAEQQESTQSVDTVDNSIDSGYETHNANVEAVGHERESSSEKANTENQSLKEGNDANYKRMEGRYKAQVKRLEDEVSQLRGQMAQLNEVIKSQNTILELNRHEPQKSNIENKEHNNTASEALFTDDEIDMFGDMLPLVNRAIERNNQKFTNELDLIKSSNSKQEEQLFINRLVSSIPNFGEANKDNPEWVEFTKKPIPFTNLTVGDTLLDAHNKRDLSRINYIFSEFAKAKKNNVSNESVHESEPVHKRSLKDFVTPDKTAVNPKPSQKYLYNRDDLAIKKSQMLRGLISKEDFLNFEIKFHQALSQGKVSA